ncbi:MAG: response regulator [Pseudomonadota bacterium]|nr:response regulator [Pseudomonadota bacterium]
MSSEADDVRVLVVDDSADAAEALALLLEIGGYVVRTAADGATALLQVQSFAPHCVLLDVDMPGIDGLELSKTLRAQYGDDIVLVAVTGWSARDARVAETFEVVDHYLRKPLNPSELHKVLPPTGGPPSTAPVT